MTDPASRPLPPGPAAPSPAAPSPAAPAPAAPSLPASPALPAVRPPYPWRPVAVLAGVLVVVGVVLGLVWTAWSPAGPAGAVLKAGIQADETEAFVGGDGRFALLTSIVGVLAGIAAWYLRPQRGSLVALALAAGGVVGALLTNLVGHLARGSGSNYDCGSETGRCVDHLPLWVQMHGLLFLEAALAVLVYSLFVAFAVDDDLGRPDRARPDRSVGPAGPADASAYRVPN